ncbi:hypothetical protein [Prevotella pallens]|uniref:hypothetical protein n=1 Tax=Prevotella pallens TaxID=60133 RepID=UPI001CB3A685|nr:hypothetical protein [Prevotella pallens]MBF1511875.1 hypothetical protein [Prevotella pallens]
MSHREKDSTESRKFDKLLFFYLFVRVGNFSDFIVTKGESGSGKSQHLKVVRNYDDQLG